MAARHRARRRRPSSLAKQKRRLSAARKGLHAFRLPTLTLLRSGSGVCGGPHSQRPLRRALPRRIQLCVCSILRRNARRHQSATLWTRSATDRAAKRSAFATSSSAHRHSDPPPARYCPLMQQRTFTATPMPVMRSPLRSRLILPTAVDQLRAALEARVAQAPDDVAARVSLGELNLSVALAERVRE